VAELIPLHGFGLLLLIDHYKPKHHCPFDILFEQSIVDLYNIDEVFLESVLVPRHIQNLRVGINCMYYLVCHPLEYERVQTAQILPLLFQVNLWVLKLNEICNRL